MKTGNFNAKISIAYSQPADLRVEGYITAPDSDFGKKEYDHFMSFSQPAYQANLSGSPTAQIHGTLVTLH